MLSAVRLSPRRSGVASSPSPALSPPHSLPSPLLSLRCSILHFITLLLPSLPPLPLLPRPSLTIQPLRLPPRPLLVFLTDHPHFLEHLFAKRGVLGPGSDFFIRGADDGCADTIQSQSLSLLQREKGGGRRACRRTYPLKQHLPHLPERAHAPFDLDHRPDVDLAQIDIPSRSRDTLIESPGSVEQPRTVRKRRRVRVFCRRCRRGPSARDLNRSATAVIEQRDPARGIDVQSDDDANEADPFDGVVEVEEKVLA